MTSSDMLESLNFTYEPGTTLYWNNNKFIKIPIEELPNMPITRHELDNKLIQYYRPISKDDGIISQKWYDDRIRVLKERLDNRAKVFSGYKSEFAELLIQPNHLDLTILDQKICFIKNQEYAEYLFDFLKIIPTKRFKNWLNLNDGVKNTPLHIAAEENNLFVFTKLLELGFDIKIKNNHDKTPIDILQNKISKAQNIITIAEKLLNNI